MARKKSTLDQWRDDQPISDRPGAPVFAKWRAQAWPYRYAGQMLVPVIAGGVPADQNKTKGWIKSKLAMKDDLVREAVAEVMVERGVTEAEATDIVTEMQNLNGFKRDDAGLYIEGRQLKAAIKEAVSVAVAAEKIKKGGWGVTKKNLQNFVAEHVHVVEDKLHLLDTTDPKTHFTEPSGVAQRFVHTWRGNAIQMEEYVNDAFINFTIEADYQFSDDEWALFWLTGENQGIGASRSQGFGRYVVTGWEVESE